MDRSRRLNLHENRQEIAELRRSESARPWRKAHDVSITVVDVDRVGMATLADDIDDIVIAVAVTVS